MNEVKSRDVLYVRKLALFTDTGNTRVKPCIGYAEIQIRLTLSSYPSRRWPVKLKTHVIVCDLVRQYSEIQFYAELKKEKKKTKQLRISFLQSFGKQNMLAIFSKNNHIRIIMVFQER